MTARIIGAPATIASTRASGAKRKAEELAKAGKVGGGGTRPFGYEDDRVTVRQDEACLLREAAGRIIAGQTLHAVLRDSLGEVRSGTCPPL